MLGSLGGLCAALVVSGVQLVVVSGNGQFHVLDRGYYYTVESTIYPYGNGWSTNATIKPTTVNEESTRPPAPATPRSVSRG